LTLGIELVLVLLVALARGLELLAALGADFSADSRLSVCKRCWRLRLGMRRPLEGDTELRLLSLLLSSWQLYTGMAIVSLETPYSTAACDSPPPRTAAAFVWGVSLLGVLVLSRCPKSGRLRRQTLCGESERAGERYDDSPPLAPARPRPLVHVVAGERERELSRREEILVEECVECDAEPGDRDTEEVDGK